MRTEAAAGGVAGGFCGCIVIILLINVTLGAVCFDYSLYSIFGKDIPWYGDALCGLFLGEIVIPAAVVCYVLRACDVEPPFVELGAEPG